MPPGCAISESVHWNYNPRSSCSEETPCACSPDTCREECLKGDCLAYSLEDQCLHFQKGPRIYFSDPEEVVGVENTSLWYEIRDTPCNMSSSSVKRQPSTSISSGKKVFHSVGALSREKSPSDPSALSVSVQEVIPSSITFSSRKWILPLNFKEISHPSTQEKKCVRVKREECLERGRERKNIPVEIPFTQEWPCEKDLTLDECREILPDAQDLGGPFCSWMGNSTWGPRKEENLCPNPSVHKFYPCDESLPPHLQRYFRPKYNISFGTNGHMYEIEGLDGKFCAGEVLIQRTSPGHPLSILGHVIQDSLLINLTQGEYPYTCTTHPEMNGILSVEDCTFCVETHAECVLEYMGLARWTQRVRGDVHMY